MSGSTSSQGTPGAGPSWLVEVDPASCYWAILAAGASSPAADAYRFEEHLPFAVERLQCAFAKLPDGRVLAAGLPIDLVNEHLAAPRAAWMWSLRPAGLPAHLADQGIDPAAASGLEFLHGRFRARPVRRCERIIIGLLLLVGLATAGALVGLGEARLSAWRAAIAELESQRLALAEQAAPADGTGTLPATARLIQAYRRIEAQGRIGDAHEDALAVIEAIWRRLPAGSLASVAEVSADRNRVLVRASVADLDAVPRLSAAVGDIRTDRGGHWRLEPIDLPAGSQRPMPVQLAWQQVEGEELR